MTDILDVARARRETPGCENVLHFNNAGASLAPLPVLRAQTEHLELEARIGAYEAELRSRDAIEHTYDALAALVGCHRDEIAVVESATRAWDAAFYAVPLRTGDRILCSQAEYAANYIAFLQVARRTGAEIVPVPNDEHGQISIEALRGLIDDRVKLIALTHVPTNGGLVNPAEAVGRVAREANVPFLLDACQSVGQMPTNVDALGCDMLSATGRKYLRGPRGTGFLYVRRSLIEKLEPLTLDLHAARWVSRDRYELRTDARRFECSEITYAGKLALGVAVDYAMSFGLSAIRDRVTIVAEALRAELSTIPGVLVRDVGAVRCGIVSFTVEGREPAWIMERLRAQGINVWTSSQAGTRLDMESRGLAAVVRASVHYYNTEEEVARCCAAIRALV
ncbi:Cysteine desulfurase [Minicystis rosea]|nr:Cysteine desulfurase [Minicystis rosea]